MNNTIQNDFSRQVNILNPEEVNVPIHVIGAGATGSWVALSLAKMGLQNINVYDFDEVGMHNLPNQMFGIRDIGRNKAHSIRNIIKLFTGYTIKSKNVKVEAGQPLQGIVFILTDTMKSRKQIYETSIKNNSNIDLLIETRMDLRGGRIYAIDPKSRIQQEMYEQTFYSDDEAEVSACGVSQTVLPSALAITSHAIWKMLNYLNGETLQNETIMDFSNEIIMTQEWNTKKTYTKEEMLNKTFSCGTKEKAKEFAKLCDSYGFKWASGSSLTEDTNWQDYRENTAYAIDEYGDVRYPSRKWYKDNGYKITEF